MSDVAAEAGAQRGVRVVPVALAAIALTAFLMVLRFPYDRVALSIAQRIERETGARIELGPVSLALVRFGPGLAAQGVHIARPDGTRVDLDRLGVRPALALAWLKGDPALAVEVESARGGASGVIAFGDTPGFAGTLRDVDLEQLPQERIGAPLRLKGRADADLDITVRETGPEGDIEFEARDGLLTHPNLPIPMMFQKLTGALELGGANWAQIEKLELASPLASGTASGTVGRAPAFATAPLKLEILLTVSGAIQGSLRQQGVAIGNDGQIHVNVSGTPTRPVVILLGRVGKRRSAVCDQATAPRGVCPPRPEPRVETLQKVFKTLSDPTRVRVLALLEQEELAVQELMDVLGMAQSRVSRHLAILREAGLLRDRRDGTYVFYRFDPPAEGPWREAWQLVRRNLDADPTRARDLAALTQVMAARANRTRSFFDAVGPEWDSLRKVFNDDALRSRAVTRLVAPDLRVADIGTGTGILAGELARLGMHVIAVDHSPRMLSAARAKIAADGLEHVDFRAGEASSLPIEDGLLDAAFAHMVLHYLPSPADAIREMARVVRPGGVVIAVDFVRHDHEWMREELGVTWLGFDTAEILAWFAQAGLTAPLIEVQPGRSSARDLPEAFIASARRPTTGG